MPSSIRCSSIRTSRYPLESAIDDVEQRATKPDTLLADSHHGSQDSLARGLACGVTMVSPAQTPQGKLQCHYTLEDFELTDDGQVLTCPQDIQPQGTSVENSRLQVLFDEAD